jgi:hypothetical protein
MCVCGRFYKKPDFFENHFLPKKMSEKTFGGRDFFQNYKKIFKILKNIILDFSFSKKQ